jgi:formylglycine-generating enzyme required for sulfatase activity
MMSYVLKSVALALMMILSDSAWTQGTEMARKKCIEFGFKDKTPSHDNCMRQFLKSTGSAQAPSKPAAAVATSSPTAAQMEEKFWDAAMAAGNKEAFAAYLDSYSRGRYVGLARANVTRLEGAANAQQQVLAEAGEKLAAARTAFEADQKLARERAAAEAEATQKLATERAALEAEKKAASQREALEVAQRLASARVTKRAQTALGQGQIIRDCADCPEMVVIPAGSFVMGSNEYADERPIHQVNLPGFLIGKTEVTQGQWKALMGSNPSRFSQCGGDCPVESVTWIGAQEFARRLSLKTGKTYRLPSEAEWEYAARAGSNTKWSFGDSESQLDSFGWYITNSESKTHTVAQKIPNAFGLFDMHGNVWEWVEDCWHDNYNGAPADGGAWTRACSGGSQVLRGGSWFNGPTILRSAIRNWHTSDIQYYGGGFRLARTP